MLTFEEQVLCGNPLQRFSSRLEPDPEPTREFGPVANTSTPLAHHIRHSSYSAGGPLNPPKFIILLFKLHFDLP
jgi:hypothetical protein